MLQGYLADKKMLPLRGPPWGPEHRPTAGSYGVAFSYERGTPVLESKDMHRTYMEGGRIPRLGIKIHVQGYLVYKETYTKETERT